MPRAPNPVIHGWFPIQSHDRSKYHSAEPSAACFLCNCPVNWDLGSAMPCSFIWPGFPPLGIGSVGGSITLLTSAEAANECASLFFLQDPTPSDVTCYDHEWWQRLLSDDCYLNGRFIFHLIQQPLLNTKDLLSWTHRESQTQCRVGNSQRFMGMYGWDLHFSQPKILRSGSILSWSEGPFWGHGSKRGDEFDHGSKALSFGWARRLFVRNKFMIWPVDIVIVRKTPTFDILFWSHFKKNSSWAFKKTKKQATSYS